MSQNLQASLDVLHESCSADRSRKRLLERNLQRRASLAAQAVGYYEADISIRFEDSKNCWRAFISAKAGRPVKIAEVQVRLEGDAETDPAFAELISSSPLQVDAILRHSDYKSMKDGLLRMASQRGYFDHQLRQHRLEVDPDNYSARIFLTLESGRRHRFGEFSLDQEILHAQIAKRYLRFSPGDYWDSDLLLESQQALLGSGYFTTARLERSVADPATLEVPATLYLSERPRRAWLAGLGVSTDTGPRLRLGYEDRYINQHGHRWYVDSEISSLIRAASSRYEIPLRDPARDRLVFSTGYRLEDNESARSEQLHFGGSLIGGIGNGWVLTRSLDYERENFTVGDQSNTIELVMPGAQVQKTRSNNPIYPRRGWKISFGLRGTHPEISSTEAFLQTRLSAKGVIPLGPARLLARIDGGQTMVSDVATLPASVRFFAGGDTSVRGFDYQTLGPSDPAGDAIGGRHLLVGSVEMDFPLTAHWHPAIFTDAGNAFNETDEMNIRYSAGAGIRWRSPLGPIRIDLARPVDAQRSWRLHLSMGPDL
ncbi:autotransporter assembly complex family protein [Alcanivorax sp. 1008]|uniref:autotransporter assembly complex protein TamA n=1 Tax=Alcanivorax sp. 1008 TaxID=2816853 RepID=UPI001DD401FA|nr:autotransporter assembly complex family protein [Alcanivorax sp. 1008]MCC1496429.1 outer membrane protein assembly factor [Alcanivorax sp. 1008]